MKGIMDPDLYDHMLRLHIACRIKSCQVLIDSPHLRRAKLLIRSFVQSCKPLLGIDFNSAAVHGLIHVPDDCEEQGPLDSYSAFPFDSFQEELRSWLRGYAFAAVVEKAQ